jgi:hypothetical protein
MKQTLRKYIADGKTKQAINELRQLSTGDSDVNNQIQLLSGRFAIYENKYLGNLEDPSVLGIELNKINHALLTIIEGLEETARDAVAQSHPTPTTTTEKRSENLDAVPNGNKQRWLKIGAWLVTAITVIAGIVQISGYSVKDLFTQKEAQTLVAPAKSDTVLIKGIVKTETGDVLPDVKVIVDNVSKTSDSNGYFELPVKVHQDGTNYRINISKTGFDTKNETYIPDSQIPEFRLHKK